MGSLISKIQAILTAPITEDLDAMNLFLIVGIVLVSIIAWGFVLREITTAASDIGSEL